MKNIAESPEVFAAFAEIDVCYYLLKDIESRMKPRTGIQIMIDNATGHNPFIETAKSALTLIDTIIEKKKFVEADYSGDMAIRVQLLKFIEEPQNS